MINYATKTTTWEEWQFEYQYGAFYIFPPSEVIVPIDKLRQTYDPKSDRICQTHISLSESLKAPLTDEQIEEMREVLSTIEPFTITYGPLKWFQPHPGVVYTIEPESSFRKLRNVLHATSPFKNVPLKREHIAPHMTIAEFITAERTEELLKELQGKVPEGTFECRSIELAVPNDQFCFVRSLRLPLGKR